MLTAHISSTKTGLAVAELRDGETLVAKMYSSHDSQVIRVVFPELSDKWQAMISVENKLIEFSRSREYPDSVHIRPAPSDIKCNVLGCTRLASFIIKRVAYCEEHKKVANE